MARGSEWSVEEWTAFVLEKPRTGKLATVRSNGAPHVVPVWVEVDGTELLFMAGENTAKARAISREVPGELLFRLTPTRVIGERNVAD